MRKLILILSLFTQLLLFSQEEIRYEFSYRENRTPTGWNRVETFGEVIFYEDRYTKTVTIITPKKQQHLYVKSKQIFIRQDTYLYTLVDQYYNECSIRVVIKEKYVELYFYSNRIEEKYYRLILKKCE